MTQTLDSLVTITSRATPRPIWPVAVARFVVALALAVWLGGIVFLGAVAAPLVFKICRANGSEVLAPQIVGAMVTRFNVVLYVCGALLLLGWAAEKGLRGVGAGRSLRLWLAQGICSTLMLLIALYGGMVLMPRLNALQGQLIPQWTAANRSHPAVGTSLMAAPGVDKNLKATFDAGHQQYQLMTMVGWWLGLATLLALSLRTALPSTKE